MREISTIGKFRWWNFSWLVDGWTSNEYFIRSSFFNDQMIFVTGTMYIFHVYVLFLSHPRRRTVPVRRVFTHTQRAGFSVELFTDYRDNGHGNLKGRSYCALKPNNDQVVSRYTFKRSFLFLFGGGEPWLILDVQRLKRFNEGEKTRESKARESSVSSSFSDAMDQEGLPRNLDNLLEAFTRQRNLPFGCRKHLFVNTNVIENFCEYFPSGRRTFEKRKDPLLLQNSVSFASVTKHCGTLGDRIADRSI